MTRYRLAWRDQGTKTSKTFLDKIATYAIGKVRRVLMPNLVKRVTKRVKEDTSLATKVMEHRQQKRQRGGIKHREFVPHIYVKTEDDSSGNGKQNNNSLTEELSTVMSNTSPVSTITSNSQLITPELEQSVLDYFNNGGMPLTIGSEGDWKQFKMIFEAQKRSSESSLDSSRCETEKLVNEHVVDQMPPLQCSTVLNGAFEEEMNSEKGSEIDGKELEKQIYYGAEKCDGDCNYEMEFCNHRETLNKRYGGEMRCGGERCGKLLWEVTKTMGHAYVCSKCIREECRKMLCADCYGMKRRTRGVRVNVT